MKKTKKFLIPIFIFLMLVVPIFSFATILVPCNGNTTSVTNSDGTITAPIPCDFNAFMTLINNVIHFILFYLVIPIAAIMFFYAGFELVTSGGSTEKRGVAKKVFTNAVIGLVIAAGAWLIISTILHILGYDGSWIGLKVTS